jgi:hypothetical protein
VLVCAPGKVLIAVKIASPNSVGVGFRSVAVTVWSVVVNGSTAVFTASSASSGGVIVFLSVNTDEDRSLVEPFLKDQKWSPLVYFEDGMSRKLDISSIPMTLIVNRKGEIISRLNGFVPSRFVDMLTDRIEEALKYADEYLRIKNKTCKETDTDEICGRYNGTALMLTRG